MADNDHQEGADLTQNAASRPATRRNMLKLGAVAVPAIATLSPSMAMASGGSGPQNGAGVSFRTCRADVPEKVDKWGRPAPDGVKVKYFNNQGSWGYKDDRNRFVKLYDEPEGKHYVGWQLDEYVDSRRIPSNANSPEDFQAHLEYLKNLKPGELGASCMMSMTANMKI